MLNLRCSRRCTEVGVGQGAGGEGSQRALERGWPGAPACASGHPGSCLHNRQPESGRVRYSETPAVFLAGEVQGRKWGVGVPEGTEAQKGSSGFHLQTLLTSIEQTQV